MSNKQDIIIEISRRNVNICNLSRCLFVEHHQISTNRVRSNGGLIQMLITYEIFRLYPIIDYNRFLLNLSCQKRSNPISGTAPFSSDLSCFHAWNGKNSIGNAVTNVIQSDNFQILNNNEFCRIWQIWSDRFRFVNMNGNGRMRQANTNKKSRTSSDNSGKYTVDSVNQVWLNVLVRPKGSDGP
jgi:hypothetical protein